MAKPGLRPHCIQMLPGSQPRVTPFLAEPNLGAHQRSSRGDGRLLRHRSRGNLVKSPNLNSAVHDTHAARDWAKLPDPRGGVGVLTPIC